MIFRVRWAREGDHVRMTFFAGWAGTTLANCGDLKMRVAEFEAFKQQAEAAKLIDFRHVDDHGNTVW